MVRGAQSRLRGFASVHANLNRRQARPRHAARRPFGLAALARRGVQPGMATLIEIKPMPVSPGPKARKAERPPALMRG